MSFLHRPAAPLRRQIQISAVALLAAAASLAAVAAGRGQEGPAGGERAAQQVEAEPFPHQEHEGLFPFCTGCHAGAETGEPQQLYPPPGLCARCHDGDELERVEWYASAPEPSNLRFAHREHALASAGDTTLACRDCHTPGGGTRMTVRRAVPDGCLSCHEHRAEEHLADADCSTCHRPLAETELGLAAIRDLPVPASHEDAGFLEEGHGELAGPRQASCTTCHTRERCTSCHVDGTRRGEIAAMPPAPVGMELPAFGADYPTPESHRSEGWLTYHGAGASTESCSTCHTRESCQSCHAGRAPSVVGELVSRTAGPAPGVTVSRRAPASHASPFFATDHGTVAAVDQGSCTTCHTEAACSECHAAGAGPGRVSAGDGFGGSEGGFHPPNYMTQHASDAWSSRLECSNCHSTAAFCRDCHEQMGMGSRGRLGAGYHDAQPLWLFRHGQAARQGLESCASCHQQQDCMQCHSTVGSFRVNPHGRDFDAEGYADRNRAICFACHLRDPLGGGEDGGG